MRRIEHYPLPEYGSQMVSVPTHSTPLCVAQIPGFGYGSLFVEQDANAPQFESRTVYALRGGDTLPAGVAVQFIGVLQTAMGAPVFYYISRA